MMEIVVSIYLIIKANRFGLRSISFGGGLNSMQQSTGQ